MADQVRRAALEVRILNGRLERQDDVEKDRIGFLRRSLTQKERKKIRARADFYNSDRGKSLREIQKREAEHTTDQEEWSAVNLEEADDGEDNVDDDMGFSLFDEDPETEKIRLTTLAREEAARGTAQSAASEAATASRTSATDLQGVQYMNGQLLAQINELNARNAQLERE